MYPEICENANFFTNMACIHTYPAYFQGSKKNPSSRLGQVDFPFGQATFSPSLPHRQAVRQLNF